MESLDFTTFPVWANGLALVAGGAIVWAAGTRLARLADSIADRTGLSEVLAGALLLGVATSLPEIITTVTASLLDNASLAVNNLFGGVAMQIAILAWIDFWFVRRGPLTFLSPDPVLLLGGVLLILQIAVSIAAIAVGDVPAIGHVGAWPVLLLAVYVASLYFMHRFAHRDSWSPSHLPDQIAADIESETRGEPDDRSTGRLVTAFSMHCLFVLAGGWSVSSSADALSSQTGIGSSFIGATLVALTTSLPEISTTAGAVRIGAYTMAVSNIFGTNSLEIALLLPADLAYRPDAVLNAVDDSAVLMGSVGIVLTALYLWGLLERRDKVVLRMGMDSWWVLLTYLSGVGLLYAIGD